MGRILRNTVPMFQNQLTPNWPDLERLNKHETCSKVKQQEYYNLRHRAQPLPSIASGTEVQVTTNNKPGVVLKETETPRQYIVQTPNAVTHRNRQHLIQFSLHTPNPIFRTKFITNTSDDCKEGNICISKVARNEHY